MLLHQLRQSFLHFFEENGHQIMPSSSLVPHEDPSLLFTNSGMVQFKNYFTNMAVPPHRRIATSQKCVRAGGKHNDLDNVGYTSRHHTFFEMLGNFSFGDYFKEEAISFAWTFLTKELQIPQEKLYVTVYYNDDEAISLWKKIAGISDSRIIKISSSDNFWQMGDSGPCGPCSEIFYDHGDKIAGGLPGTPEQDGDRYVEIWNLVFTQFDLQLDGSKLTLPQKCIDTGSGIERLAAVMQGKTSNYDIDLFQNIMASSKQITKSKDGPAHRVIADHLRTSCFLIADGVMPSNEGRGYVLRRIMRRAMRYVHQLQYKDALLYQLVPTLVTEMGASYPELKRAEAAIVSTLRSEEEKFRETLDKGMRLLEQQTSSFSANDTLSGEVAFKLYDTYGFPLDLTRDILRARNININESEFETSMAAQKKLAKAGWAGSGDRSSSEIWLELYDKFGSTEFLGYTTNAASAQVLAIVVDDKVVSAASLGTAWIVLNQTPFYAESGGQVGDTGFINNHKVLDVKKYASGVFAHLVELHSELRENTYVEASINIENRHLIMANHSATHLLHKALRELLGEHVTQKGSYVNADKLRFDFSHTQSVSATQLKEVEHLVNQMIISNNNVDIKHMGYNEAVNTGAMALFGEKYADEVRVIKMGDSVELCGGTHVHSTGDIGIFKITSEESVASGIRRIEACTGLKALAFINNKQRILEECLSLLKCPESNVIQSIEQLKLENKQLKKDISNLQVNHILNSDVPFELINGAKFIYLAIDNLPVPEMKNACSSLLQHHDAAVVLLISSSEGKSMAMLQVAKSFSKEYQANALLKKLELLWSLKGGGNPELAQAGSTQTISLDGFSFKKLFT